MTNDEILDCPDSNLINFNELSVKLMWEEMKDNLLLKSYFPDYPPSVRPNAGYFYKVVNTLFPGTITEFLKHAYE